MKLTDPLPSRLGEPYERLVKGNRLIDLLWHWPYQFRNRLFAEQLSYDMKDGWVTVVARIKEHVRSGGVTRILVIMGTQEFYLLFFKGTPSYWYKKAPVGTSRLISGILTRSQFNEYQIIHPDVLSPSLDPDPYSGPEPVYHLTYGLTNRMVREAVLSVLKSIKEPFLEKEWLPESLIKTYKWPSFKEALLEVHNPKKESDVTLSNPARQRLFFEELWFYQSLLRKERQEHQQAGPVVHETGELQKSFLEKLPFALTKCQKKAIDEIGQDLNGPHAMLRLLQGDVGSGKTCVAFLSALKAIESGYQAVLVAPTDILARQHYQASQRLMGHLGIKIHLLTAREKGAKRKKILQEIAEEKNVFLIGTHALFEDPVVFSNLGLVIIDEQHRFGVEQRLSLTQKGNNPHVLTMTATPIPRTLLLARCGDMSVSTLKEKPSGRKPIETLVIPSTKLERAVQFIKDRLKGEDRAYWVCPLIEESESSNLVSVEERVEFLKGHFPSLAVIHGKMKAEDKEEAMRQFSEGEVQILVSTTVIEVGVDVPEASIIVIEEAQRFGLAQLHQLRGRVGRGNSASTCLLIYQPPLSPVSQERLKMMKETTDGFKLAEADLRLRGGGDLLGIRQTGFPKFKTIDPNELSLEESEIFAKLLAQSIKEAKENPNLPPYLEELFGESVSIEYKKSG